MEAEERSEASQRNLSDKWQDAIRVKPESQRRWDVIKVVLRSLSLLCAIGLVICSVALVRLISYPVPWIDTLGALVPGCLVIFWALAELITICVRTRKSGLRLTGIPPGAHVAADLLIWIITASFLGVLAASVISALQARTSSSDSQIGISVAILGLEIVIIGLHFTLFVRACMETERRNSEKRIRKAIVSLRQRGLNFAGLNFAGMEHTRTEDNRGQESHELSPLAPDAPRHGAQRREPVDRLGKLPATPSRTSAQLEAVRQMEENMKFVMPVSIMREMTDQKYTMMGPADGRQKYPGIRR